MSRTAKGPATRARKKALLKKAKGYSRSKNRRFKTAKETVIRALRYAKRDRRVRKREFRSLWIRRINAATRAHGLSYSRFLMGLARAQVALNRKSLAHLAVTDSKSFSELVALSKEHSARESRQAA